VGNLVAQLDHDIVVDLKVLLYLFSSCISCGYVAALLCT
jgi:hypothetical protein